LRSEAVPASPGIERRRGDDGRPFGNGFEVTLRLPDLRPAPRLIRGVLRASLRVRMAT
jgi:hypothetical protein